MLRDCIRADIPSANESFSGSFLPSPAYGRIGLVLPKRGCKPQIHRFPLAPASRVRGRIEQIVDYAAVRGWRGPENPARWKGRLQMLLPARSQVRPVVHHAAEDWRQMPALMARLTTANGIAARALCFGILTAARSGEVRMAVWPEIDFDRKLWVIPKERMKGQRAHAREHVVPLSEPALAILREMHALRMFDDG